MPPSPKRTNSPPKKKNGPARKSTWVERVVETRAKKNGYNEELTFPAALAWIGITPDRAEKIIAWNIKRIPQFREENRHEIIRACINLYRIERQRLIDQRKRKK